MEERLRSEQHAQGANSILRRNQKPQAGSSDKNGVRSYSQRRDALAVLFKIYFYQ